MKKISASYFRQQIEQYFDDRELDVMCERRRHAYTIIRGDDGSRLARLRPTGRGDEVELYSWNEDRWQPVGATGNVMPLPDALEYITDDPDELFCGEHDCEFDEVDETEYGERADDAAEREGPVLGFAQLFGLLHEKILIRSLLSGAIGGLGRSASEGLAVGILAAITCSASFTGFRHGWRILIAKILILGIPVSLVAAAAGTLGGSIHQYIGSGVWAVLGGALAGGVSSFMMLASRRFCWLLSFSAAFLLTVTWRPGTGYMSWFVVSVCAAAFANLYGRLARFYHDARHRTQNRSAWRH